MAHMNIDELPIGTAIEIMPYAMPQSNEMLSLRFGLGHLMDLIKNTAPDNTTD